MILKIKRYKTIFKKKLLPVHSLTVLTLLLNTQAASAKCGSVNYSWGADALASAHDFTVTMMLYEIFGQNHTHISYLQIKLKVFINHL